MTSAPFRDWPGMVRWLRHNMADDGDNLVVVDGYERSGKSTLAMQLAQAIDPTYDPSQEPILDYNDFRDRFDIQRSNAVYLLDEGGNLMFNRDAMRGENKLLQKILQQTGQTNSTFILCCPNFNWLDPIIRIHRCQIRIHVYRKGTKRGQALVGWREGSFSQGDANWLPGPDEPRWSRVMRLLFKDIQGDPRYDRYKALKRAALERSTDALWRKMEERDEALVEAAESRLNKVRPGRGEAGRETVKTVPGLNKRRVKDQARWLAGQMGH